MAYATKMAAALSGATVSQLRHWRSPRTGPLLAPEIAATPRAVYSFQDVLALRTFVRLREHASLQKIRSAIGNLRDIGEVGHLASYRLVSDKSGNIQLVTEDQAVNLGEKPGQLQLVAVIGEIIEPFAARAGVLVPHLLRPRPGLSVDPETQGGTPVITGTRVPYDAVAGLMRDGVSAERPQVLPDARNAGFHALITRDRAQFSDPRECDAIKKSGLHHIRYAQRQEGTRGLALAIGAIIAAMPMVMQELEGASGQRLVQIASIDPRRRFEITDPQRNPPSAYWPR